MLKKNRFFAKKKPLNYYSLKVTTFHGDSVKNESARTKKLQRGPPPLFRVKGMLGCQIVCDNLRDQEEDVIVVERS